MQIERDTGVMTDLAKTITTDSGEQINYPTVTAHGTAAWIAENGSYTASDETSRPGGDQRLQEDRHDRARLRGAARRFELRPGGVSGGGVRDAFRRSSRTPRSGTATGPASRRGISTTVATGVTAASGNTTNRS